MIIESHHIKFVRLGWVWNKLQEVYKQNKNIIINNNVIAINYYYESEITVD